MTNAKITGTPADGNQWGVTPLEAAVMDAYCRLGNGKRVARELGVSIRAVENHLSSVGRKMDKQPNDRVLKYLEWDRWRRGQA